MLRFGLIGHGRFGKHYERLLGQIPGVELAGIATRHTTTSVEDILKNPVIDAVIIATPASTHADIIRKSLGARKHVLVEKPMVMSVAEANTIKPLLNDRIFMVGYQYLFNQSIRGLKNKLPVHYYLGETMSDGPLRDDISVFMDAGVHDLSIIEYLFSPGKVIAAEGQHHSDFAAITVTFANGLRAHLVTSRVFPEKIRRITLANANSGLLFDDRAVKQKNEPLRNEFEHFIDCIKNGKQPLTDFTFGLQITKHCDHIASFMSNIQKR